MVSMMQPHAYVWATGRDTCPGDKLKPSVSGWRVFPEASSGVTVCHADVWRCIAQIAAWPAATFRAAGSVTGIKQRRQAPKRLIDDTDNWTRRGRTVGRRC